MAISYKTFIHSVINFIFPPRCVGCNKSGEYVCMPCLADIARLPSLLLADESIHPLYSYRNKTIQKSIFLAKYRRVFRALYPFAKPIAQTIFETEKKLGAYPRPLILVPIPSTKKSVRKRGFNQTEVLAKHIVELYSKDFEIAPILFRSRINKKQTECTSRAERIFNMKDVFAIKENTIILPRAVYVLLDDVITTGATMRSAQQTLTEAGARTVISISIAYQELH